MDAIQGTTAYSSKWRERILGLVVALAVAGCANGTVRSQEAVERSPAGSDHVEARESVAPTADFVVSHVREPFRFTDLRTMVDTADLIVTGRVLSTSPGRTVGTDQEALQFLEVNVDVTDVLKGEPVSDTILIEENGWLAGQPVMLNGLEHSRAGDEGIYFLTRVDEHPEVPSYRLTSTQGRYLVTTPDGDLESPTKDEFAEQLARLDADELVSRIVEARGR